VQQNREEQTFWNTQQKFKARIEQHMSEVKRLVALFEKFNSCVEHFGTQFSDSIRFLDSQGEEITRVITWHNPNSAVKKIATTKCRVCQRKNCCCDEINIQSTTCCQL